MEIKNITVFGLQQAIKGCRRSYGSKSDSHLNPRMDVLFDYPDGLMEIDYVGENDLELISGLAKRHPSESKFLRMITVYMDITAPLYWWKQFDTYKVGTVSLSESTMHTLTKDHLTINMFEPPMMFSDCANESINKIINTLNDIIDEYNASKDEEERKDIFSVIISILPQSFKQTRTVMLNYAVLRNIMETRSNHKLSQWRYFCRHLMDMLPFSKELLS